MNLKLIKIKAAIFTILSAFFEAIFGLYIGRIIDAISIENKMLFFERLIAALLFLAFGLLFSILSRANIYKDICNNVEILKNKIYVRELNKDRQEGFDMANFTSKIDLVFNDNFMNRWLIFEAVFTCIFSSLAIISVNWIMFVVSIVVSIIPMVVPSRFKGCVQNAAIEYSRGSTQYVDKVNDTLKGRLEIIKYQVIEKFIKKHEQENKDFEIKRYKSKFINYKVSTITNMVGFSAFLLVFLTGGLLVFNDIVSIGGVIGVIQLMNNIVNPIVGIASKKNAINSCAPVLEELNTEYESEFKEDEILLMEKYEDVILSVHNLTYSYTSEIEDIVHEFSQDFKKGGKYVIQGESGSGKTTLAKLLSGELKPKYGKVEINGQNICEINRSQLSQIISYVDQTSYLFKDTIYNNIDLYRGFSKNSIDYEAKNIGIDKLDIDKLIDDSNGISGGQKSRVCLLRAVMNLPKILIVDEPTAALDNRNTERVMKYLCSLPITLIVISHHLNKELVDLFDEIIKL